MAVAADRYPSTAELLRVDQVAVRFGALCALDGVDLQVRPGEIVALAGENGAGKSTLVRCIAGDMTPTTGRILVAGQPVVANPGQMARRGVAVVWQNLALCDNLDVAENLLLGREAKGLTRSPTRFHLAAAELLDRLHIPLRDTTQPVHSLSGGQRQLLAVAKAMRDDPQLLILDEPTAALGVLESAQVEGLMTRLRDQGTTILLVSHDIEQMFRLADRIAVLRRGRVVGDIDPGDAHPDDVVALISGQEVDASARRQLTRLHGLVDRLASADPSSSVPLILSALGAALGTEQLALHIVDGSRLRLASALGIPPDLRRAWEQLPFGPDGGSAGRAAASGEIVIDADVRASRSWLPWRVLVAADRIGSSWSVPVVGSQGLAGVITVLHRHLGRPPRDELDLVALYAGYAASALEREHLLGQVTARNRVLETIREVLETLAGPASSERGLLLAAGALHDGLQAEEVALFGRPHGDAQLQCRACAGGEGQAQPSPDLIELAGRSLGDSGRHDGVHHMVDGRGRAVLAARFIAPGGPTILVARWSGPEPTTDAPALLEDAANSLRLALEREEAERAHQEATALRRSQELQRQFLSRLSHELRTPLTAIRGYASSLMQTDVTWDEASEARFLSRIAAESARLGRLVDDLLDFSAIESSVLRLHPDWCDLSLVLDAAVSCLAPPAAACVDITCDPELSVIWADHDRLEQVFVNLLDNALRHNPPGTRVHIDARTDGAEADISVTDTGTGVPTDLMTAAVGSARARRAPTSGAGLGLSIARGIVDAHGGRLTLERLATGTRFRIRLPLERAGAPDPDPADAEREPGRAAPVGRRA
jgi:signal transduction histidine kinase/ABC-type multidrug transport system ATPase subunit